MIRNIFTNLLLSFVQVALGALIAYLCLYLAKARLAVIRVLGWVVAIYFLVAYSRGTFLSVQFALQGAWKEWITAFINVNLGLATGACVWRSHQEHKQRKVSLQD